MNAQNLTNVELYKLIIGESANKLADVNETELYGAEHEKELTKHGLTKKQSEKIMAAVEIGKRLTAKRTADKEKLNSPQKVAEYLMPMLRYKRVEEFWVVCLDNKNMLIKAKPLSKGIVNTVLTHCREIFRYAMLNNASSIVVAHNHPSGDIKPSIEDEKLTQSILFAGKTIGLPLVDHIIIGDGKYYSFEESGFIKN